LVTLSGSVTTIAGSPGVWGSSDGLNNNALFYAPSGIAVDSSGNVYVTDSGNNTLRKITPSGADWSVTTATGVPGLSGSVDSGSGAAVLFYHPSGIAVNSAGYLFVTDAGNNTIRTSEALTILTWAAPAAVTYGTAIGNAQLNASAPIAGTFAYNPVSGTVLNSGTNMLAVQFTPQDAVNNRGASATVNLAVLPASLTVTAGNARRATGLPNPPFGGTIAGLQNSDNITATYSSIATPASPAGGYPIVPNLVDPNNRQTNYVVTLVNGTLTVVVAPAIQSETRSGNSFNFTFSSISNQMYQIQYSTNLSQTNWFSLGAPVTATNSTITISDTGAAAVKFYRISLYP
jgi:hypothetical protein